MRKLKENKVMTIDLDGQTVMHFTFWVLHNNSQNNVGWMML